MESQVDALVAESLAALGYRHVNLYAGWAEDFNDLGIPKSNLSRFPSGMEGMARYMHERGLLFGIYLNPGIPERLYQENPMIAGTTDHIADITDTSHAGSTLGNGCRIDFTQVSAALYVQSQVKRFDASGIDFIKLDFIGASGGNLPADNREEVRQWHTVIAHSSRLIWLELSKFFSIDQAGLWQAATNE